MSKTLFAIDIDGTLAHTGLRFSKAGPEPTRDNKVVYVDWVKRVQNVDSLLADRLVSGMDTLLHSLNYSNTPTIYLTSREEMWREVTEFWLLNKYNLPRFDIVMRSPLDYREGAEYKEQMIKLAMANYSCTACIVIDDDEKGTVEAMCKTNAWTFLKARSGGQL